MNEELQEQIPKLYSTESIPFDQKIIYQRYYIPNPIKKGNRLYDARGFNWLLAELDRETLEAFGWVNLNNDENAECGYIWLPELKNIGAVRDEKWLPLAFPEAKKLVYGYRDRPGTKEHHDWWLYENRSKLLKDYKHFWNDVVTFEKFLEQVYKTDFDTV